jgi:hypothetical protein
MKTDLSPEQIVQNCWEVLDGGEPNNELAWELWGYIQGAAAEAREGDRARLEVWRVEDELRAERGRNSRLSRWRNRLRRIDIRFRRFLKQRGFHVSVHK